MAPILPSKATRFEKPTPFSSLSSSSSDPFPTTKADKRRMKHSTFVSRIEKPKSSGKSKKPRRPSKKLVATLESLADALPEAGEALKDGGDGVEVGNARIRQKSLRSRPGAMKKKAVLERAETERFRRNLAEMAKGGGGSEEGPGRADGMGQGSGMGTSARWAALRSFISTTMERKESS